MIDNNIIQSLGAGSGIDSRNIVKQLTEIERAAPQERIDTRKEKAQTQISDFGLLASAMDTLKASINALSAEEGMYSKTGSITDTTSLLATADPDAQNGSYSLTVGSLAQSQSVVFAGLDSKNDAVGEGTLTFEFGNWDRDNDGVPTSFNADADAVSFDITIDSTNNSLTGLRDAINDADMGVQASIVFDGSVYRLALTAESGANNELNITANDTDDGIHDDEFGISRFAYNTSITDFEDLETQAGEDASLTINGLEITRETNSIDDVIDGLTFDLLAVSPESEKIQLTISDDKAIAETNVRNFVDAYNAFLEEIDPLFSYDEEEEKYGSLYSDSLAKSVLTQFRNTIASEIPGLTDGNYNALTNVGIRTELDGTLSIDEDDFSTAFSDNFEDVQKLFSSYTSTEASYITVNSFGKQTLPGEYDVSITTAPTKGNYQTDAIAGFTSDVSGAAGTLSFNLTINGTASDTIIVDKAAYADGDALASAIQSAINNDQNLTDQGISVVVGFDTDNFTITSTRYGSNSSVRVDSASGDAITYLGIDANSGTRTTGVNVAGTIDGKAGFGLGNVLLPALGEDAAGLSLIVSEGATTGVSSTVSYSRGFAGELESAIKSFLQTNGLFDQREEVLNRRLDSLEDDQTSLDRRMSAYEERLLRQFIAMENILNGLNSQGGFLDNLSNTLPFTSGND